MRLNAYFDTADYFCNLPENTGFRWCHSGADTSNDFIIKTTNIAPDDEIVTNSFAEFMTGGQLPSNRGYMNCWECILYIAFIAGASTEEALRTLHTGAALAARSSGNVEHYFDRIGSFLGYDTAAVVNNPVDIEPGDVLFFEEPDGTEKMKHVVIAGRGGDIYNHNISSRDAAGGMGGSARSLVRCRIDDIMYFTNDNYVTKRAAFPF